MSLEKLAELSRLFGSNPGYVIAGGGNTSFKDDASLYVKASGTSLATIRPEEFVKMNRAALARVWTTPYPADDASREAAVLADLMAARAPGEENKRPSVETLLHDLLPDPYVVHTHPALVNGVTCSREGEAAMKALFPQDALWIPSTNPGYILSKTVKDALDRAGRVPCIFLQNHGVFVSSASPEGIIAWYQAIMTSVASRVKREPRFDPVPWEPGQEALAGEITARLAAGGVHVHFIRSTELLRRVASRDAFAPVASAFTPDHIVYSGAAPLFVTSPREIPQPLPAGVKLVACQSLGAFGVGPTDKAALNATELFNDTLRVAAYAESFGGGQFMSPEQIGFITNWEVERYRAKVSAA